MPEERPQLSAVEAAVSQGAPVRCLQPELQVAQAERRVQQASPRRVAQPQDAAQEQLPGAAPEHVRQAKREVRRASRLTAQSSASGRPEVPPALEEPEAQPQLPSSA